MNAFISIIALFILGCITAFVTAFVTAYWIEKRRHKRD